MARSVIVQSLADYTHAQLVTGAGFAIVADEPLEDDGNGLGPGPFDLLNAALGACTAMTIQMYARRRGYPLQEVAVEVEHSRIPAEECTACETPREGIVDVLRRKIVLRGPLDEAQRADLLRVASRCPVHRTLKNQPEIFDTLEVVA